MIELNNIYQGDNINLMKQLDDNSIDNCISDFPYNLNFMSKEWDNHGENFYKWCHDRAIELYRIMKPGSFTLIFGSAKTNHRMKCAFEDAGFEIKDEIDWIYSSAMPKGLDISKAFDKDADEYNNRPVIGKYKLPNGQEWNLNQDINSNIEHKKPTFTASGTRTLNITEPVTELAKRWNGYKTELKPAKEPITIFQKTNRR